MEPVERQSIHGSHPLHRIGEGEHDPKGMEDVRLSNLGWVALAAVGTRCQ
jgi:hypothetical protein